MNKKEQNEDNNEKKDLPHSPFFDAPDGKILATADMFRSPYTGFFSDMDLNNPGNKLITAEEKLQDDLARGNF